MTLIETVNHEFYELLGHLNDNKHGKIIVRYTINIYQLIISLRYVQLFPRNL